MSLTAYVGSAFQKMQILRCEKYDYPSETCTRNNQWYTLERKILTHKLIDNNEYSYSVFYNYIHSSDI